METLLGIILGLVILIILVVVHEFGHAYVARKCGVVVEEFGIGFPPRAWSKKLKNKVLFSLNWLPLGGFVKLQGENDNSKNKGDYGAVSLEKKALILLAGVIANWLLAVVLFAVLAFVGLPKIFDNQFSVSNDTSIKYGPVVISDVKEGFPAEKYGFNKFDEIISFNGLSIDRTDQFINLTKQEAGKVVFLVIERDNQRLSKEVRLLESDSAVFGATLSQDQKQRSTWSSPIVGVVISGQLTWETLKGLGNLLVNLASGLAMQLSTNQTTREEADKKLSFAGESVAGPIGILGVLFPSASQMGVETVILLSAIISLTLAVMNILPVPALDGGRLFVTLIYRILKKPLTKKTEEKIHSIGFYILMGLVILITILDINKIV